LIPGAGDSQAWDRYAFALNNPVNFTDPDGHRPCNDDIYNCEMKNKEKINLTDKQIDTNTTDSSTAPCEKFLSSASCQRISKFFGIGVVILDLTSFGISLTGVSLEIGGAVTGGPPGFGTAVAVMLQY